MGEWVKRENERWEREKERGRNKRIPRETYVQIVTEWGREKQRERH